MLGTTDLAMWSGPSGTADTQPEFYRAGLRAEATNECNLVRRPMLSLRLLRGPEKARKRLRVALSLVLIVVVHDRVGPIDPRTDPGQCRLERSRSGGGASPKDGERGGGRDNLVRLYFLYFRC